jgi:hypothetical protein
MELGGAVLRQVDMDHFSGRPHGLTAFQRANELVLRVSCISEAFSGGTATVSLETTSHELPRGVYETILRDEARHRRLGGLYFEWAMARIDEGELARLGRILLQTLRVFAPFWKHPSGAREEPPSPRYADDLAALGWLPRPRFGQIAREVMVRDILDPLATIGIAISPEERAELLGPS